MLMFEVQGSMVSGLIASLVNTVQWLGGEKMGIVLFLDIEACTEFNTGDP